MEDGDGARGGEWSGLLAGGRPSTAKRDLQ